MTTITESKYCRYLLCTKDTWKRSVFCKKHTSNSLRGKKCEWVRSKEQVDCDLCEVKKNKNTSEEDEIMKLSKLNCTVM
jgi:hypothetical protein